jgi:hypothetical protein
MEAHGGVEVQRQAFLISVTTVSPGSLYFRERARRPSRRSVGPKSRSGRFGQERDILLTLGIELRFHYRPSVSLEWREILTANSDDDDDDDVNLCSRPMSGVFFELKWR